jgi:protocatechuate 3,4-dioxygenase beta subunit
LKALVPASAIAGGWLLGCGGDAPSSGPTAGTSSSPAQGGASGGTQASAGSMSAAAAGNSGSAQAGASAMPMATAGASGGTSMSAAGQGGAGAGGSAGTSATTMGGAGGASGSAGVAAPGTAWASGGTKSMQGNYPDPFAMGQGGAACMLYPTQTLGPCYAQTPAMREDISDGSLGLPVRLSFLVVRMSGCAPVADASIDIWHSGADGIYSAFARGTVCNPGTMEVRDQMFCRGVQLTNDQGRADFSTVFPGWYAGRAIHIHFTIRVDGRAEVTSQLYFEDALTTEIQAQGQYAARGMRDTMNSEDMTFRSGGASPDEVIMQSAKRPDGVLHAWKVLSIG